MYENSTEAVTHNKDYAAALAMAYVPMQKWSKPYDPDAGLSRGTVFPELDLPFLGMEGLSNDA